MYVQRKDMITIHEKNYKLLVPESVFAIMKDLFDKLRQIGEEQSYLEIYYKMPEELQNKITIIYL